MSASHPPAPDIVDDTVDDDTAGFSDPVLNSAFEPMRLAHRPLIRTRLLDRLSRGVREKSLTLLSAPAGAGKTVLAASWVEAAAVPWPVAWLTVDDACDRPELFWPYLMEALARAGVTLPQAHRPVLGEKVPAAFLTRLAADILEHPHPIVLVLDGANRLLSREATAGLDFLIRHACPRFRLVMCGRADPQLPLHKYRLTDSMTELRLDALAFTSGETRELLASLGVTVSKEVASSLTEQTEGWAAGLRLAAASLKRGVDPTRLIDSLARDDGSVAEYLFAEVLDAQPPRLRQFLLRTSVTPHLWPELVDLLTDRTDGRRTLAALVRANAFVERPPDSAGVYRMHPLFRELLKAQLAYESPQDVPELHRRCAKWFASTGEHVTAVEHAAAGGDWGYATSLLIENFAVGSLLAHDNSPYSAILQSMPAALPGPGAAVLRAAWACSRGCAVTAADAEHAARLVDEVADTLPLRASAAVVRSAITAVNNTDGAEALKDTNDAIALLAQLPPEQRAPLSAVVLVCRATTLMQSTGEDAAVDALGEALAASTAARSGPLRRKCLGELALLEALRGRLRRATELGHAAEGLADECGLARNQRPPAAPLALAWVQCEEFHHAETRRWVARTQESATDQQSPLVRPLLAVLQARLLRSQHDFEMAENLLEPFVADLDSLPWVHERVLLEAAGLQLAQARPELAMAIVDALPDPHTPRADVARSRAAALGVRSLSVARNVAQDAEIPLDVQVDGWIDEASRYLEQGDVSLAATAVESALQLAESEQMRRPFINSTPQLRKLLRTNHALSVAAAWLSPSSPTVVELGSSLALPHSPEQAAPPDIVLTESLSERETEVLRHLSELLSTEEIGAAMFVSVNTVRTHVRSILRKLAVSRRNEAVRRARELALV